MKIDKDKLLILKPFVFFLIGKKKRYLCNEFRLFVLIDRISFISIKKYKFATRKRGRFDLGT